MGTPQAIRHRSDDQIDKTAVATVACGDLIQLDDGRAAVASGLKSAASGDRVAYDAEGLYRITSASATLFALGDEVWWDQSASLAIRRENIDSSGGTGDYYLGRCVGSAKVNGDIIVLTDLNTNAGLPAGVLMAITAAGAVNTPSSTAENVIGTYTIPANLLRAGDILKIHAAAVASTTNSTDTFTYRIRVLGLTGAIIAASTAVDLADGDSCVIDAEMQVRTSGASGTYVGSATGINKTTAFQTWLGSTAIDTTVGTVTIVVTVQVSASSASDICALQQFTIIKR